MILDVECPKSVAQALAKSSRRVMPSQREANGDRCRLVDLSSWELTIISEKTFPLPSKAMPTLIWAPSTAPFLLEPPHLIATTLDGMLPACHRFATAHGKGSFVAITSEWWWARDLMWAYPGGPMQPKSLLSQERQNQRQQKPPETGRAKKSCYFL